jgi:hypothetical protein
MTSAASRFATTSSVNSRACGTAFQAIVARCTAAARSTPAAAMGSMNTRTLAPVLHRYNRPPVREVGSYANSGRTTVELSHPTRSIDIMTACTTERPVSRLGVGWRVRCTMLG